MIKLCSKFVILTVLCMSIAILSKPNLPTTMGERGMCSSFKIPKKCDIDIPTCGFYVENCEESPYCFQDFSNPCDACNNKKVVRFFIGIACPYIAIQPPVIEPPVIEPPVIEPPVIEPPVIEPPVIIDLPKDIEFTMPPSESFIVCEDYTFSEKECESNVDGTCGFFNVEGDCNKMDCQQVFQNPCLACRDPRVKSVSTGTGCSAVGTPLALYLCNDMTFTKEECESYDSTTCGFYAKDLKCTENCFNKYDNPCLACQDPKVDLVETGAGCPEIEKPLLPPTFELGPPLSFIKCHQYKFSEEECNTEKDLICGYFKFDADCINGACYKKYKNECEACKDIRVDYVENGAACPSSTSEVVIAEGDYNDRNPFLTNYEDYGFEGVCNNFTIESCYIKNNPTCGIFSSDFCGKDNKECGYEFANPCEACADSRVQNIIVGSKCLSIAPDFPERIPPLQDSGNCASSTFPKECPLDNTPTCGFFKPEIQCDRPDCFASFNSACEACKDDRIATYHVGIACPDPLPMIEESFGTSGDCDNFYVPKNCESNVSTCGFFFDEFCEGPDCFSAFDSACHACNDERVKNFTVGLACPLVVIDAPYNYGDNGLCSDYSFPEDCSKTIKNPTCGFFSNGDCDPSTADCFRDYQGVCEACKDPKVKSFHVGIACPLVIVDPPTLPEFTSCSDVNFKKNCKCKNQDKFVCAEVKFGETKAKQEYYDCACEACNDRHVTKYREGLCPGENTPLGKMYECKTKDRKAFCTEEYKGVCAVTSTGLEEVGTVCQGCQRDDVYAVYNSKCPIA